MMNRSFFGACAACFVALAMTCMGSDLAKAAVLANWTFENFPDASGTAVPASGVVPEAGIYAAGSAASLNTGGTVNTVAGNGSVNSYSSNGYDVGEGFTYKTSSLLYSQIKITWDETGSNTGPRDFKVQYSTDGSTYTDIPTSPTYVVLTNGAPNPSWASSGAGLPSAAYTYTRDLSAVTALNNQANIFIRMIDNSTTSINGGTVASGGTGRMDNVIIEGTLADVGAVPLPAGVFVFAGVAGFGGVARRRLKTLLS